MAIFFLIETNLNCQKLNAEGAKGIKGSFLFNKTIGFFR